jgi:undecaprenyl-diphosphatase
VLGELSHLPDGSLSVFAVGFLSAALSGYFCIRYFLSYLQRHALTPFIIYRMAVGAFLLVWFALHS